MTEFAAMRSARALRDMVWYLALTFGITWSVAGAALFAPNWMDRHFGPITSGAPLFYLAVWAPNIAALLVTAVTLGGAGIKNLLARLIRVRVKAWVWAAALLFYPALMLVVEWVGLAFGDPLPGPDNWRALAMGLVSLPLIALGPLGEELGWRGFLLPRLLDRIAPLPAALILGTIWMVWHIPAFFLSGVPQSHMFFPIFAVGGIALNVFLTWLFLNARQSILIAGVIPHAIANAWGDAIGPMTWINAAVLVLGAVALVRLVGLRDLSDQTTAQGPAA